MSQETRVFQVSPQRAIELERALVATLPAAETEWRPVPYARFSVKACGVVLTCYQSGKVVLQGQDLDTFQQRFAPDLSSGSEPTPRAAGQLDLAARTVASDESGKGDYFGPLVVAAVFATPADARRLHDIGVADSKLLDDARVRRVAALIEREFDHEIAAIPPREYNHVYAATGNLNTLLAELHARALARLLGRHSDTEVVIVDKFGNDRLVADALSAQQVSVPRLVQVVRAEQHPAVAAASIVARAAFLDGLAKCSDDVGTDLPKGAGSPVDGAAKRVARIGGRELLGTVAKLHFRNTTKIPGLR